MNALTNDECQALIDAEHDWHVAILIRGDDCTPRTDSLEYRTFKRESVSVLGKIYPTIRKEYISMYETGDFCKPHRDCRWGHEHPGYRAVRTWITPLNDDYEGGELYIDGVLFEQKIGETIKFDGRILHEITTVTSGTRHSLISWVFEKK